ncbi:MAG: B12-binding domain-containing radical SAM protein [Candidatus Helarchaeota archaeon]
MDLKVLLLNPRQTGLKMENIVIYEHLGLGYLASFLRQHNITTKILDADALNLGRRKILEFVGENPPDIIGFTTTAFNIAETYELIKLIKNNFSSTIILGGNHATFAAYEILSENSLIDYIVYGEGELTFKELLTTIAYDGEVKDIKGIYYRDKNRIIQTAPRELIQDLDLLPFPARDVLEECISSEKEIIYNIVSSRGCPGNCSFCSVPSFYKLSGGPLWRSRSPKNFVAELEYLITTFGNNLIDISDDNFLGFKKFGKERIQAICEEILDRELQIKFVINARADSFTEVDEPLIKLLKEAGLIAVHFGFEAGTHRILKLYQKNISLQNMLQAYTLFSRYKISCSQGNFIMFNPYVTIQDLQQNVKFFFKLDQVLFWELSSRLYLFPGIALITQLKKDRLLKPEFNHKNVLAYKFKDQKIEFLANFLFEKRIEFKDVDNTLGKINTLLNLYDSEFLPHLKGSSSKKYEELKHSILKNKEICQNALKKLMDICILILKKNSLDDISLVNRRLTEVFNHTLAQCQKSAQQIEKWMNEIFQLITFYFSRAT